MKYFELPDSSNTRRVNFILFDILKNNPEWFVKDLVIEAVYGCPTYCIWNGGCVNYRQEHVSPTTIKSIFDKYNNLGISYRLTFTNRLISNNHLDDIIGNEILQIGNNSLNGVIVANDIMENYIYHFYPKYNIIQSLCRVYQDSCDIIEHSKNTLLCLPIKYNNKWDYLSNLYNKSNLIVLVNEFCPVSSCELMKEHYESDNRYILGLSSKPMECVYKNIGKEIIKSNSRLEHHICPDDYKNYEDIGIEHFKVNGRGRSEERIILEYARLLVKESYSALFFEEVKRRLMLLNKNRI